MRRQLREAQVESDRLRKLSEREAARADAQQGDAGAAKRAAASATGERERLAREVVALRVARDNSAAALEDSNAYAKKLENKVAGPGGFLVDQNARLRGALSETAAQHSVRRGVGDWWERSDSDCEARGVAIVVRRPRPPFCLLHARGQTHTPSRFALKLRLRTHGHLPPPPPLPRAAKLSSTSSASNSK